LKQEQPPLLGRSAPIFWSSGRKWTAGRAKAVPRKVEEFKGINSTGPVHPMRERKKCRLGIQGKSKRKDLERKGIDGKGVVGTKVSTRYWNTHF